MVDVYLLPWAPQSLRYTKMGLDSESSDQQRGGWLKQAFRVGPTSQLGKWTVKIMGSCKGLKLRLCGVGRSGLTQP